MILRVCKIFVLCLLMCISWQSQVQARKLVILTADRLQLGDITKASAENFARIIETGAIGLISPNCLGLKREHSVLLTAASGQPSEAGPWIADIKQALEPTKSGLTAAGDFFLRTGVEVSGESGVVLQIAEARRINSAPGGYKSALIGDSAKAAGKRIAAIGNADVESELLKIQDRSASILAADSSGVIQYFDPYPGSSPGAVVDWLSNPSKLSKSAEELLANNDVVFVCFGDLVRLDTLQTNMRPDIYADRRLKALAQLDRLAGELRELCEKSDAALVVASFGLPGDRNWDRLTPVIVWGQGRGLLKSPSTRTRGIITAADFAPSMLKLAGITAVRRVTGRPAYVAISDYPVPEIMELDTRVHTNKVLIAPMGGTCAGVSAVVFCVMAIAAALRLRMSKRLKNALKALMLFLISLPAAMIIAAVAPAGIGWYIASTVIAASVLAGLATVMSRACPGAAGCSAAFVYAYTALIIVADALAGSPNCRFAMPSSYYLSGMRYYGIGNEYAAFGISMAGCAMLFIGTGGSAYNKRLQQMCIGVGAVIVVALGWGTFGANYGATAAATTTFVLLAVSFARERLRVLHYLGALVAGLAVSLVFSELDAKLLGNMSTHAGRAARIAGSDGAGLLAAIVIRKIVFNIKTMLGSTAGLIFAGFVPFLLIYLKYIHKKVVSMLKETPAVSSGFLAMLAGAGASLLLNDSGVVMASIILGVMLAMLLFMLFEEEIEIA